MHQHLVETGHADLRPDLEARWGALVGPDRLQDVKSALTEILGTSPSHGAVTAKASAS